METLVQSALWATIFPMTIFYFLFFSHFLLLYCYSSHKILTKIIPCEKERTKKKKQK